MTPKALVQMKALNEAQKRMAAQGCDENPNIQGAAQPYPPIPVDILDGIQFHRKSDRLHLSERIAKAISHTSAVSRIYADNRNDQRLKEMESHYELRIARLEADLREAYDRNANHLIDRAREGNRVVTRGGALVSSRIDEATVAAWKSELALAV